MVLLTDTGNTGGEWLKGKGISTGLLNFEMLVTYLNEANKKSNHVNRKSGKS